MNKKIWLRSDIPLIISICLCVAFSRLDATAEPVDRIAAVVNDKSITFLELKKEAIELAPSYGYQAAKNEDLSSNNALLKRTLDHMINEILIEDEIKKRGIEVQDTELEMFVRNIMSQNKLKTTEELKSALAIQGMTLAEYKKSMRKQIHRTKIMNYAVRSKVNLSDQDLKNYYMQHMGEAREPDSLHLRNIFINKNGKAGTGGARGEPVAKAVIARLKQGEKFEGLVKKYSEDSNAKTGGDLGFLTVKDLNAKIYGEVSKLKPGQHTGLIDTEAGYYILKLEEKREGKVRPFESMKDELRNTLTTKEMENQFTNWLTEIRDQAFIDIKL